MIGIDGGKTVESVKLFAIFFLLFLFFFIEIKLDTGNQGEFLIVSLYNYNISIIYSSKYTRDEG